MMRLTSLHLFQQQCYIDGQWLTNGEHLQPIINPATGEVIGHVPQLTSEHAEYAITAAQAAFQQWKLTSAEQRAEILGKWYQLMIKHRDDLATILTTEQGKPFAEAQGEISYAASFVKWYSEQATRVYGETIPSHRWNAKIIVTKQPIGVVAAITPWNFPAAMITRKCAPAMAAGCTVVLKPAPETPFTALALAQLAQEAGFPKGVLNVLTGDAKELGEVFTRDKRVRKLSFTGSTQVGKLLMQQSAASIKKVSLELGGNAPFIVFDDADIDAAVEGAIIAKFRNAGQTCVCANRIFVHSSVYDEFAQKLTSKVNQLNVGDGFAPDVTIAPVINKNAAEKVRQHVEDALSKGATALCGRLAQEESLFIEPLVLTEMNDQMLIASEETFGPVAPLFRFSDEAEVIQRANHTDSGLAAYLYTRSLGRAWRVADALEVGMVGINEGLISTAAAPFGGVKESGLGREGSHHGIEEFLELKYMLIGGLDN